MRASSVRAVLWLGWAIIGGTRAVSQVKDQMDTAINVNYVKIRNRGQLRGHLSPVDMLILLVTMLLTELGGGWQHCPLDSAA